ncbi:MAG: beta-lactamase family protein [Fidelibacterota bacterium]|nr:MAG: beta-lactamase family protein [Candidatus Neomarinimicrobiota bacterium]
MKAKRVAIVAVLLLPFLSCDRSLGPRIDSLFTRVIAPHSPGAAVAIVHHDQVVHAAAFGTRDVRSGEPITLTTNFRLASLTKQFTAMAVMILEERGVLGYDDPLTAFFPEFPDYGRVITVHHLLTHTSGLKDYEDLIPAETTVPLKDRDVLTLLTREAEGDFPPGTRYHYSNSGYALLALIVEQVSGLTFADFLRTTIFSPLDMTATVAFEKGISTVPERAFGHTRTEEDFSSTDQSITSSVLGDGGIYSSVTDLMKWDRALYSDQLVTRETMETAFSSHADGEDRGQYGYGWFVRSEQSRKLLWHYGSTIGFRTAILRIPEIQLTVIVLANRNDIDAENTAHKILDWTLKAFY